MKFPSTGISSCKLAFYVSSRELETITFASMESVAAKSILRLQLPTDPRWVNLAEKSLEEILTDHAYCEQKAATSCISLIQRYNDREKLVTELSPIVTEEWGHFRLVLAELQKRNFSQPYVFVGYLIQFYGSVNYEVERAIHCIFINKY